MSKLKYVLLIAVSVSLGLSAWIAWGQGASAGEQVSSEEALLQQTQGMTTASTDQPAKVELPEELAPKKEEAITPASTPEAIVATEKPAEVPAAATPASSEAAVPEELVAKEEVPVAAPVVEKPVEPAPSEAPEAVVATEKPAEVPAELAAKEEVPVAAPVVEKPVEPAPSEAPEAVVATEKPAEPPPVAVVAAPAVTPSPEMAAGGGMPSGDDAAWERRSKDAQAIAQQEEVRRKAKALEAKKSVEKADLAYKNKDYETAFNFYHQVLRDVPPKGDYVAMRKRAMERIPECEYRTVLALTKLGRTKDAYDLGLAYQTTNKLFNVESPDLDKTVTRLKDEVAVQAKKSSVQRTALDIKGAEAKKRMDVQELMKEGREFISNKDYEKAKGRFEAVLAIDPANKDAMKYLTDIAQRRLKSSTLERTATTKSMAANVRAAWNPPDYKEIKPPPQLTATNKAIESALINKMKEIVIPEIEFRQANIHDVVDFLNKASIEGDKNLKDGEPKRGVNLILNLGQAAAPAAAAAAPAGGEGGFPGGDAGGAAGADTGLQKYNITFTARYISMKEALDIITSIAGLKYRAQGNVVMITTADFTDDEIISRWYPVEPTFMTRISEVGASMAQRSLGRGAGAGGEGGFVSAEGGGGSSASDIKQQFIQLGIPFPGQATIQYNPTISKVFIANTAENIAKFEALLNELNVVPSQVEIEARFVEINETEMNELGVEWLLNDNWEVAQKKNYPPGTPVSARERVVVNQNNTDNGFTKGLRFWGNSPAGDVMPMSGGSAGKVLSISSILTNPQLTFILHALEQQGHADVLSAPKVTTRSGVEASIRVVTEYIYPTEFDVPSLQQAGVAAGDGAAVQNNIPVAIPMSFEMREVGVILTVLPEVSPNGGTINLTMTPQVVTEPKWMNYGSVVPTENGDVQLNMPQPFFNTRTLTTQISIYDGATVVMGGLIKEDLTTVDDRIPFLGDIPLLGRLFRSTSQKSEKKNLLIFVTASLVDPGGKLIRKTSEDIAAASATAAPAASPK